MNRFENFVNYTLAFAFSDSIPIDPIECLTWGAMGPNSKRIGKIGQA
jgi:hypothetical protein